MFIQGIGTMIVREILMQENKKMKNKITTMTELLLDFALGKPCIEKIKVLTDERIQMQNRIISFGYMALDAPKTFGPVIMETYYEEEKPVKNLGFRYPQL